MSNKEIFLKSFADLLHSYDKFIKYAAHNYCYCSEKKKKDEYNDNYYEYLNDCKKVYKEIEKDNLGKYNIQIRDIKKILYDIHLEKDLCIVKNKQNKPIAISFIKNNFKFHDFFEAKLDKNPYIHYKDFIIMNIYFSRRKMKSFKITHSYMNFTKKINQKRSLKKLYKLISLMLDMYNYDSLDTSSKNYNSLEIRTKKFKKLYDFYKGYAFNCLFSIEKELIFNIFANHKLFKIEKEELFNDGKQRYVIVYKDMLKLIYFSLYKDQLYCNPLLYNAVKDEDFRLYAIEFLRDYMTMSLV